MSTDHTHRFSKRVQQYIRYRPSYPAGVWQTLKNELNLTPDKVLADVGSGTGLLTQLLLQEGHLVYGVEPNEEMRTAGEQFLSAYPSFRSINGRAEATTLPGHRIDLLTAGQAFHWFDPVLAKAEFQRVLRPGGAVALVWNGRDSNNPFLMAFEQLLRTRLPEYAQLEHKQIGDEGIYRFMAPAVVHKRDFHNEQSFDWEGLLGRAVSSSYFPLPDQPAYEPLVQEVRQLFDQHQVQGQISFPYLTELYWAVW